MRSAAGRAAFDLVAQENLGGYQRVLIADIVGTGLTMAAAQKWLRDAGLSVAGAAALLERRSARLLDTPLLAPGISAPSVWIVGSGLGRGTASLPDLHVTDASTAEP
jgi:hypoxanthine-guanine phosphoribosyltransferase